LVASADNIKRKVLKPWSLCPSAASKQAEQEQQYNCPYKGNENGAAESGEWRVDSKLTEQPAAEECADDPNDNVADETAGPAAHHERGQDTSDQSNYQPCDQIHINHPEFRVVVVTIRATLQG
jgi:hypothetical protein